MFLFLPRLKRAVTSTGIFPDTGWSSLGRNLDPARSFPFRGKGYGLSSIARQCHTARRNPNTRHDVYRLSHCGFRVWRRSHQPITRRSLGSSLLE